MSNAHGFSIIGWGLITYYQLLSRSEITLPDLHQIDAIRLAL